jgi:metal-dependent amidase/aminoacylase/carboxypeptidase family protein
MQLQCGHILECDPGSRCFGGHRPNLPAAQPCQITGAAEADCYRHCIGVWSRSTNGLVRRLPSVTNDPNALAIFREAGEALQLRIVEARPSAAGEDFAFYQEKVPGSFIWMGTGGTEEWHHPKFTLNEDALVPSAALFALTAVHALESEIG